MNLAISLINDEHFIEKNIYRCISIHDGMVEILSKNNESVTVDLTDNDFIFIFNCNDDFKNILKEKYQFDIKEI